MASMVGETYVLQAVQQGLASIQSNPAQLSGILDALSTAELASAQSYFGNPQTVIKVAPGFPMQQPDLPFIGVTLGLAEQDMRRGPVGWNAGTVDNGNGTTSQQFSMVVNAQIKATIYTANADLIVWLSEIVWWAIATQSSVFLNAGFGHIGLSMGDYEPQPDFLPVFTFVRGLTVSMTFSKGFLGAPVGNATSASVSVSDTTA